MITKSASPEQSHGIPVDPISPSARSAPVVSATQDVTPAPVPSFSELYSLHFSFVWRTLRRLAVREDRLDDVLQEVFLTISQRLPTYDPSRTALRSWIYGIAVNLVSNERRRWRRKDQPCVPLSTDSDSSIGIGARLASPTANPAQALEELEAFRLASQLLEEIPEDRREILILADLEEMPMSEVAESLGINVNTAYARLRTARKELDEALARHRARQAHRGER